MAKAGRYTRVLLSLILFFSYILSLQTYASYKITSHRQQFIRRLATDVATENNQIKTQRRYLQQVFTQLQHRRPITTEQQGWVNSVAASYKLKKFNINSQLSQQQLLKRVNIIPSSMVIAQAINESNWGRSRFAQKGNNLFGIWCFRKGCGLVPRRRAKGKRFEVKAYPSKQRSIQDYFYTLNTGSAYRQFRQERAELSAHNQPLNGITLVEHMRHYSAKGAHYVRIVKSIIHRYHLEKLDQHSYTRA